MDNLDPILGNSKKYFLVFKGGPLKFIRPSLSNVFDCDNHKGIRLITRLCVGLSHLCESKFKHIFQDCLNPICSRGLNTESLSHFLPHCPIFNDERYTLLSSCSRIDCKLLEFTNSSLLQTLL